MLEFCVSIPNDQYYRKGVDKYLFRRAFTNILPDKVLNSVLRGQQAADLPQRLKQEISEVRDVVKSFNQSEFCHRYMDLSKIETCLAGLEQNNPFFFRDQCGILTRGLMVGLFLTHFEGRPFNERATCSPEHFE
jgi:asparagine synthase (glutamine-hydrolysing)